ncbi:unnamed protein product [Alopecurus aequalis]
MSTRLAAVARWCGGGRKERQRHLRRHRGQRCVGTTVWLGGRRRGAAGCRLAVSRLVRWRLVADLLRPIRKALTEMAAAARRRQLVALPVLNFPFVGTLSLPVVVA